ncbi:MAG: hypothetical protein J6U01_00955 [Clostridia bacterium]|nr:hypothetical protein [Clostridia bacterium]
MKEAKKVQVTDQICKQAQLMRRGGANQTEIGKLLGVNPCTISRIEKAGFNYDQYMENRRIAKEKEKKAKEQPQEQEQAEEQVPGQIEMELVAAKPQEMTDQVKLMRFQAGQIDKLVLKLDHINDTLNMILRVMRKE